MRVIYPLIVLMKNLVRETRGEELVHWKFFQGGILVLPIVNATVEGRSARALIYTGCSLSVLALCDCQCWFSICYGGLCGHKVVDGCPGAVLVLDLIEKLGGLEFCNGKMRFLSDGIIAASVNNDVAIAAGVDNGIVI
ncbi:hypothetical protein SK128_016057 [Halocaridina rubra]|uniref:Uncharacterized protein n=1 Tax=Halocaridina rubra TaxID=373956 RepID=A0AAN8XHV0_HALRR